MAERVETHAVILSNSLTSGNVADDALPLAHFAPLRRSELIDLQAEVKPFVRGDKGGEGEGSGSKSARKGGGAGFKADSKSKGGKSSAGSKKAPKTPKQKSP